MLTNKTLMLAVFSFALFLMAKPAVHAQYTAQLEEKTLPVGEFSQVTVSDNFEVTLVKGAYSVKVTADQPLAPYVQVYVRSKQLYISYDSKSVPKDVKNLYKGKDAPTPVFRATVFLPELNGLTLKDNATLLAAEEFAGAKVELNVADKAQIKSLTLKANKVSANLKKNAQATLNLPADKLEFSTEGSTLLKATVKAHDLTMTSGGSSSLSVMGDVVNLTTVSGNSSKLNWSGKTDKTILQCDNSSLVALSGEADTIRIKGERSSTVDGDAFTAQFVEANLSGSSTVNIAVTRELDATLVGGSALYYTGTPTFKIGKIVKSTLAPAGTK